MWTGDCPRGGCADKCIVNEKITNSWFVLLDRSMGEESYGACPLLAQWVWRTLSITSSSRRRLLSDAVRLSSHPRGGPSAIVYSTATTLLAGTRLHPG